MARQAWLIAGLEDNTMAEDNTAEQERGLTSRIGPVEVEWPLTVGYYGGIALAIALELIEPPLALFVAAIPFLKMLNQPGASQPTRLVSQVLQGMAKPVGGDSPSSVRLTTPDVASAVQQGTPDGPEARQTAAKARAGSRARSGGAE
jgi:hypothetical protein